MFARISIVGRPNVGKSTLFNRLIGRKKAIVHSMPGVTRDRNEYEVSWKDKKFIIVDTAGWSNEDSVFSEKMAHQLEIAVEKSDIIIFLTDAKTGLHSSDMEIANILRKHDKKIILAINKVDSQSQENKAYEFYRLGIENTVFISANHGRGINDLLDKITQNIKHDKAKSNEKGLIKIILVGKPNVGKSSFMNTALKEERSIVHDIAGTTRDSLTATVSIDGRDYLLTDTAGLHRGNKAKDDMQYLSTLSAHYAIEDADIAVLIADASCEIGETESKIAGVLEKKRKAIIIAVNKWDLIEANKEEIAKYFISQIREKMKFIPWADILFISAKTGQRLERIFSQAENVYSEYTREIPTEKLNAVIRRAIDRKPYIKKGKTLKIKSFAQIAIKPPMFLFYVNNLDLLHFSYKRYIENSIRDSFGFKGTPIILKFRKG